jgi:hypothetical protein
MQSITVSRNTHSIVFSRGGSFITSVPIRRRVLTGNGKWTGLNVQPGEIVDLMRRLSDAVNSDRPGTLLQKIHDVMSAPFIPHSAVLRVRPASHLTRPKSRRREIALPIANAKAWVRGQLESILRRPVNG